MTWNLVRLADVAPMPWRNGGGVTRELIAWPDAQAWAWRISVAEVASDGLFSRFDGVQRWLAILRGAGVRLSFAARTIDLTAQSGPLSFAGTDAVDCALLADAVQDLNLMLRGDPALASARMRRIGGVMRETLDTAGVVAVYGTQPAIVRVQADSLLLPQDTLAWRVLPAGAAVEVTADNAIWMQIMA